MKNKKTFMILYFISFIFTIISIFLFQYKNITYFGSLGSLDIGIISIIQFILLAINGLLVLSFVYLKYIKKFKIKNCNNLLFIIYILFSSLILILCYLFNNRVVILGLHFIYYSNFVYLGYLFTNIYSLLCLESNRKK